MNDFKQGWVRFYRKSIDSSVWKNPNVWFVWSWCLFKSNHEDTKFPFNGEDMEIKKGQFITGINKAISELPTLSPQNYRTAINYLKSTGRITIKSNNKFSIITIAKWQEYQIANKQNNRQTNKPLTNEQQATNKPLTTYKNVKKDKNDKEEDIDIDTQEVETIKEKHGEFENVRLKKEEYDKLILKYGEKNTKIIIEELSRYMASKKTKYINHYATLLNWASRKVQQHNEKGTKAGAGITI